MTIFKVILTNFVFIILTINSFSQGVSQNRTDLLDYNILNNNLRELDYQIKKIEIRLVTNHSWGLGKQYEKTIYYKKGKILISKEKVIRKDNNNKVNEITKIHNDTILINSIRRILNEIYLCNLKISVKTSDTVRIINLENKKNEKPLIYDMCSDCNVYKVTYKIYTNKDTVNLYYAFSGMIDYGLSLYSENKDGAEDIKSIINWLYAYKIIKITFKNSILTTRFFNYKNLDKIIEWNDKYDEKHKYTPHNKQ